MRLRQKLVAEFLGTSLLLAIVVGSGIMGDRLSPDNVGVALLANAAATAAGLYLLIVLFGPISGAHFNPAVTLALHAHGQSQTARLSTLYVSLQIVGAVLGVWLAHAMFAEPLWQPGTRVRAGSAQLLSEAIATFGLVLTILLGSRHRPQAIPALVASWIFAAYWFTASTSFANPAVTLARALTQSFAGIRPIDAPGFIVAQLVGAGVAALLARWMFYPPSSEKSTAK